MLPQGFSESENRITECLKLEGTRKHHRVQLRAWPWPWELVSLEQKGHGHSGHRTLGSLPCAVPVQGSGQLRGVVVQPASRFMAWASALCYLMLIFRAVDLRPPLLARPDAVLLSAASHVSRPRSEPAVIFIFVCAGAGELPRELWLLELIRTPRVACPPKLLCQA